MPISTRNRRLQCQQRRMLCVPRTLAKINALIALASTPDMQESSRGHIPGPTHDATTRRAEYYVAKLFSKRFRMLRQESPVLCDAGVLVGRSFRFECNRLLGRTEWVNPSERRQPNPGIWAYGGYGGWLPDVAIQLATDTPTAADAANNEDDAGSGEETAESSGGWGTTQGWGEVGGWGNNNIGAYDPGLSYSRPAPRYKMCGLPLPAWRCDGSEEDDVEEEEEEEEAERVEDKDDYVLQQFLRERLTMSELGFQTLAQLHSDTNAGEPDDGLEMPVQAPTRSAANLAARRRASSKYRDNLTTSRRNYDLEREKARLRMAALRQRIHNDDMQQRAQLAKAAVSGKGYRVRHAAQLARRQRDQCQEAFCDKHGTKAWIVRAEMQKDRAASTVAQQIANTDDGPVPAAGLSLRERLDKARQARTERRQRLDKEAQALAKDIAQRRAARQAPV
ncbi:hypothetical protein B0H13DRAFT_1925351 [Mycena leptocephala]|nr:hypothetical protein B0H13DRAFT_1925351 [Mycena leptocephala]